MVQKDATVVGAGAGRVFLLLQGPMSFFFTYLAAALRDRDAVALRMLFCPGDGLFHRGGPGIAYRGRPRDWPAYAESFMRDRGVTDLVCLGDGRRWHEDGIAAARRVGARVHLVEQGYLRPHFLTVEPDGTGGRSRFPREWPAIEALAKGAKPPEPPPHRASFLGFAAMDVAFNLANLIGARILYPHYERHAIDHPAYEWAGWIWNKALKARGRARALQGAEGRLARHEGPVFLTPLQLDTDYQIRLHAPPGGVEALLRRVVASFAAHAPADALLAVKAHPLDHGWADWDAKARAAARREGIAERLVFLDGGDLGRMLTGAA
ncbi:MAG: capsular biosynthesis protein, partial [Pseudomonadota bacterium]